MEDEPMARDEVSPEGYVDDLQKSAPQIKARTQDILKDLRRGRIFFYPACGFDWTPLHRFTHLCDTFVYCDYGVTRDEFRTGEFSMCKKAPLGVTLNCGEIFNLDSEIVTGLATADAESSSDFPKVDEPWGQVVYLTRHIGDQQRKITLLYFRAEAVTLYRNIFNKRSVGPRVICFKGCLNGMGGDNWTTFLRWDGPLGRAVWENHLRPEFVISRYEHQGGGIAQDPQGHSFDWPWNREWQTHSNWKSAENDPPDELKSYVLGDALRVPAGSPERYAGIVAQLRPLNNRTVIRLKRPNGQAELPHDARQYPLDRETAPTLQEALKKLKSFCRGDGIPDVHIDHVYSNGCHFEDEAPALYAWKWNNNYPKSLTIQCESEGDLACYGPVADEIIG